jgi:hypothetical protein
VKISLDSKQQRYQKLCCGSDKPQQLRLSDGCFQILERGRIEASVCFGDIFQDVDEFSLNEYILQPMEKRIIGACASNLLGMNNGIIIRADYGGTATTDDHRYILYRQYDSSNVLTYNIEADLIVEGSIKFINQQFNKVEVNYDLKLGFVQQPISDLNLHNLELGNRLEYTMPQRFCLERAPDGTLSLLEGSELIIRVVNTNFGDLDLAYRLSILEGSFLEYGESWSGSLILGVNLNFNGKLLFGGGVSTTIPILISEVGYGYGVGTPSSELSFISSEVVQFENVSIFSPINQIMILSGNSSVHHYPLQVFNPQSNSVKIKVLQF